MATMSNVENRRAKARPTLAPLCFPHQRSAS